MCCARPDDWPRAFPGTPWPGPRTVSEDLGQCIRVIASAASARPWSSPPDVVVMDLHMSGLNGIDATRQITAERPGTAVLVPTMLDGDDPVFAAMRAGARGYLFKGADRAEIGRALIGVAHGKVVFSAGIASRVRRSSRPGRPPRPSPLPRADRSRTRGPRPGRPWPDERRDRPAVVPVGEDGAQPCFERVLETAGGGPGRGGGTGAGRGPGRWQLTGARNWVRASACSG